MTGKKYICNPYLALITNLKGENIAGSCGERLDQIEDFVYNVNVMFEYNEINIRIKNIRRKNEF